jgi:hypothetical protein
VVLPHHSDWSEIRDGVGNQRIDADEKTNRRASYGAGIGTLSPAVVGHSLAVAVAGLADSRVGGRTILAARGTIRDGTLWLTDLAAVGGRRASV